jgi:hypothetical protein
MMRTHITPEAFAMITGYTRGSRQKQRVPVRALRSESFGGCASSLERHGIARCSLSATIGQPPVAREEGDLLTALSLFI